MEQATAQDRALSAHRRIAVSAGAKAKLAR